MPPRSESKRARLERWLAERQPGVIDGAIAAELKAALNPISDSYLQSLLRHTGYALAPEVEGVNTHSLDDLERTLLALGILYEGGSRGMRQVVIAAKDHLKWAVAKSPEAEGNELRQEMILWTLTWLENPSAFPMWVALRRRVLAQVRPATSNCL